MLPIFWHHQAGHNKIEILSEIEDEVSTNKRTLTHIYRKRPEPKQQYGVVSRDSDFVRTSHHLELEEILFHEGTFVYTSNGVSLLA